MSVAILKTVLNGVFGKTLTNDQVRRISEAFYTKQEEESLDEAAAIVIQKLRNRIKDVVKVKEAEQAANAARQQASQDVDNQF